MFLGLRMKTFWVGFVGLGCLLLAACSSETGADVEVGEGNAVETESEALLNNALTPAQAKTTLRLIDDICGDTWCEGDNNFGFRRLTCSKAAKTCTLTFQILPRDAAPGAPTSYWRTCKTPGFTGFRSLVVTAKNGYQSLNDGYYDSLGACISRVESHLH